MGRHRPTLETFTEWLKIQEQRLLQGYTQGALDTPKLTTHLGPEEQGRAWAIRASACRRLRLREEAEEAWSVAFGLSPDDPWLYSRFAVWLLHQGHHLEALRMAAVAQDRASPDDRPFARCVRGMALWFCGHREESLSDFTTAAQHAPVNSPTQIASIVNIAVALANASDIDSESARLVLGLVARLRADFGKRKLPRARALLRWAGGLAQVADGRRAAGTRDLLRARRAFLALDDSVSAAAVTLDYEMLTDRPQSLLFREIINQAPADARSDIITRIEAMAAGRSDSSQHNTLKALVMTANVRQRWSQT